MRAGPSRDATIVGSTDDRKMRLIGATIEKDLRWWIFGDYDPVTKKNVNYYAKNIAQFSYSDNFRRSSEECSSFVDEPTTMAMLKSNRRMLKKGFTKKIANNGFHSVSQLSGFGVTVLELCQELQGNVINFNLNYKLNNTKSAEISTEIEYKMEYAGKVEVFDISGEVDNISLDFLNTIRSELINF